ncbi:MAG TPA: hypothetical protein VFC19_25520 [Candidatus Limnocylindrales bacterium]|nr:hypothetical protein [Candidatus Limnocylindrales bacterium]
MPVVVRVVVQALQSFVSGLRWLARQAYRQRSLGVASNPQLTRLLDVHFATVAAHLALLSALLVAAPSGRDWLLSLPMLALFTAVAIWRPTRLVIGLLLAAQLLVSVVAAVWAPGGILLTMLFAMAVAQQTAVIRGSRGKLGRATAAGLLVGVFTGGAGLVFGLLTLSAPLWIFALLLAVALVLSLRMPPPPERPKLPKQVGRRTNVPEGYAVYRPSSLDERR